MSPVSAFFAKTKDGDLLPVIGLLIFSVIGYLPISSGLFALKNDDFIYFLPYRFNVSEIIRSGHLPLWSPYIYMGFPIAGDMQSGAWNPLVWLISLSGAYDLNRLAIELLIYLFIAALGMYKLGRTLNFAKLFAFTIAISFMFCGFMTDSGQILCWVACASFIPFTWLYYARLVRKPGVKNAVKFSLANLFLALAGYPAFFIINGYILLLISIILIIKALAEKDQSILKITVPFFLLSAGLFLLTGMIAWLSFIDLLPFYTRGQGVSLSDALEHSYQSRFAFTALTPFAHTWATHVPAGVSGNFKNIYFGILLLPFALYGAVVKRTLHSNICLFITALATASSLGTELPFRSFEFHYLPLMNSFRHPANFRIFGITGLLMLAGKGLQQTYSGGKNSLQAVRGIMITLVMLLVVYGIVRSTDAWPQSITRPILQALRNGELFTPSLLANIFFQIIFLVAGFVALRRERYRMYCLFSILNVMALAQPQIFFGMVSSSSPQLINEHIKQIPKGFPTDINDQKIGSFQTASKINDYGHFTGIASFYLKRPVINQSVNNPTMLTSYLHFFKDSALASRLANYPVIFFGDSIVHEMEDVIVLKRTATNPEIKIHSFGPNEISFSATVNDTGMLSVFQNNYPGWEAFTDEHETKLFTVNHTFMGVKALHGEHMYQLKYRPRWLLPGIICSLAGFIVCAWLLVRKSIASGTSYHNPY